MSLNTLGHLGHHHGNYHVQVDSCGKTSSKNKVVQHTPVYISLGTHTSTYCDSTIMMQNACIVIKFFLLQHTLYEKNNLLECQNISFLWGALGQTRCLKNGGEVY